MNQLMGRAALAFVLCGLMAIPTVAQEIEGPLGQIVYVTVSQNRELSGTLLDITEIKVSTSFGDVQIPVAKIDGIKMHADANDAAVIAFKNGDLVTGKVTLETVKLKTEWGTAHVNTSQIEQITTSKNAKFFPDSSTKGWRFSKGGQSANTQGIPGLRIPN